MKYQCKQCTKIFIHPAKQTNYAFNNQNPEDFTLTSINEASVCPFCRSREYSEFTEPIITDQKTTAVLVVDLVTGENLALNKALADGYEIIGRYAKQYTLEKKAPKQADPCVSCDLGKDGICVEVKT